MTNDTPVETTAPTSADTGAAGDEPVADVSRSNENVETITPEAALETLRATGRLANVRVSRLRLQGEFTEPIELHNVVLVRLHVDKVDFRGGVVLSGCKLIKPRFEKRTVFHADFGLFGCDVRNATIRNVDVHGKFRVEHVEFTGHLRISRNTFHGDVKLWQSRFGCWVDIGDCTFEALADFRSFHAEEGFAIERCTFAGDLLMRGSTVAKKLAFDGSRFEQLVDVSKAKFHDFVYLENVEAGTEQRYAFGNVVADRVLIQPSQIEGRLESERDGDHATAMREYGFLKRNYESLHRFDDEDWAFYRFKVNQRKARPASWSRPWTKLAQFAGYLFLDLGCGYGTNAMRAVSTAIVLILLFAGLFAAGIDKFAVDVRPIPDQPITSPANRLAYGLMTSVSVFTAGFTGEYLNVAHGWVLLPLTLEALLGTLLWGLFIVAFSRKVIR